MTIRDVKDGQRFTIPNNKGIWHMETRKVSKEYVMGWGIDPDTIHRDMYNEEGGIMWGAHWDMKIILTE